jgi:hypothetical protein
MNNHGGDLDLMARALSQPLRRDFAVPLDAPLASDLRTQPIIERTPTMPQSPTG